ncbi:hypothetical protein [Lactococcus allomyrinae]|uniref:Uncharacterized protein n=1 Tax=Lactococcus allomyrinae TaxID=2419773 RepID=A0A387BKF4_9LACT|nr:hypothetical protein [Lactococcus allomyrinae]AYG01699.1 hypothetical protein D7I46_11930 [Lactococcus allomyrinae]
MATNNLDEIIDFIENTLGYVITPENRADLIKEAQSIIQENKNNQQVAFIAVMIAIVNNKNIVQENLHKKVAELQKELIKRGLEVDTALKGQLRLLAEYDLLRYNLSESFINVITGKPPDKFAKTIDEILLNSAKESKKYLDWEFDGIENGKIVDYNQALSSYFDYKARLYASNRKPSIIPDYDYYKKLYAEKIGNIKINDFMSDRDVALAQKAIKQAVNAANRFNRFDLMYRQTADRFEPGEKGIYAARAAADEDCKAHQGIVMTREQFWEITPVHPNCLCTLEPRPYTYSDQKWENNMMLDDGTIPKTADIYRKAGTSRYPTKEYIGKSVENKYKFKYALPPKSHQKTLIKGELNYEYTEPNSFNRSGYFNSTTRADYYNSTRTTN